MMKALISIDYTNDFVATDGKTNIIQRTNCFRLTM